MRRAQHGDQSSFNLLVLLCCTLFATALNSSFIDCYTIIKIQGPFNGISELFPSMPFFISVGRPYERLPIPSYLACYLVGCKRDRQLRRNCPSTCTKYTLGSGCFHDEDHGPNFVPVTTRSSSCNTYTSTTSTVTSRPALNCMVGASEHRACDPLL